MTDHSSQHHAEMLQPRSAKWDEVEWLPEPSRAYRIAKRLFDIVFSFVSLVILAPAFVLIAAAIKLTSRGPIFYRQLRVGYHGKIFSFVKFRTMRVDLSSAAYDSYVRNVISHEGGESAVFKLKFDPRITTLGRFLRRTSLDELPQFLNVLRGEMSLVGPRPALPFEVAAYEDWQKLRFSCKPGITGLWQVEGRYTSTFEKMVELDVEYIKRASFFVDLRILVRTPVAVLRDYR